MADEALRKDLDALKADIAKLREDMAGLSDTMRAAAGEKVAGAKERVQERARQAREELGERVDTAMGQGRRLVDEVDQQIGQHPFSSLLTAFGLGFVIAKLLDIGGRR
jgi:ElaB/YqjD/DUF883 family membrane-anchored ribosome-binding protein